MIKKYIYLSGLLVSFGLYAQENDTIALKPMLITGQVIPGKIDDAVYSVEVITSEQIQQMAANNLADLLNQSLNIQVVPDNNTGKSGISMFGLNSEYVKVLVDNIPLVNDEGFGNFTDFTQINLEDIEQIEIVEGAMGVEYGADAVAGIINIITNKKAKKLKAKLYIQEESVGNEYKFLGRGKHIKGINLKGKINAPLSTTLSFNQNKFDGWFRDKKGGKYFEKHELRGHEFRPKNQYDFKSNWNYRLPNGNIYYTFNYLNETINKYNTKIESGYSPETDLYNPTVQDERFTTNRWIHHLNYYLSFWDNTKMNFSASYQTQKRENDKYTYYIIPNKEDNHNKFVFESKEVYYAKMLLGKSIIPNIWQLQLSAEGDFVKGIQSPLARPADSSTETIKRELGSYDVFTTSEIHVNNDLVVRPGIRALFSSQLNTAFAYNFSVNYKISPQWEARAMYGDAPKKPTYDQLYTYFVDSNHHVVGNINLSPEKSHSIFLHLFYKSKSNFNVKLSGWHIDVKDKINLIISNPQPLEYMFKNFETYKNQGVSISAQLPLNNFTTQASINYSGDAYESNDKDMLYSLNANFGLNYYSRSLNMSLSTNLKYNGKEYKWKVNQDGNLVKGTRDDYTWWDMSLKKRLLENWEVVLGARNLLDIKDITNTTNSAEAHQAENNSELFAYGRSYFIKLNYNIPF